MENKFLSGAGLNHLVGLIKAAFAAQNHEHQELDSAVRILNGSADTPGSVDYKIAQAISHGSSSSDNVNILTIHLESSPFVDENYDPVAYADLDNSIWESNFDFANPPSLVKVIIDSGKIDRDTVLYFKPEESRDLEGFAHTYACTASFEGDWILLFVCDDPQDAHDSHAAFAKVETESIIDDYAPADDRTYSSNKIDQLIYNSEHKVRPLYVTDEAEGGKTYKIVVREGVLLYESLQPSEEPIYD